MLRVARDDDANRQTAMSAAFDGADVDVECVAYRDGALYYRSRRDPRALRRSDAREAALARDVPIACCAATATGVVVGDDAGYVATTRGVETRVDVARVVRACGEYASSVERCVRWDARTGRATRRWTLPRLAPMTACAGAARANDGTTTLIAVGGAAIASTSATSDDAGKRETALGGGLAMFRKFSATALSVAKTFVDRDADVSEDAVGVYEGVDMDEVSALKREKPTWNCAFVDAPRRYTRFEICAERDCFAVGDETRRVLLFRILSHGKLRLKAIIKGCRDATFAFDADTGALYVHRPSVRLLEIRSERGDAVETRDASGVARVVPGSPKPYVLMRVDDTNMRVLAMDEFLRRAPDRSSGRVGRPTRG